VVGKKTVPITSTITLQGGLNEAATPTGFEFVGAKDENTLSKTPPAPNKSIKGNPGELMFNGEGTILTVSKNSLVNNSYAAPATNGCGGIFEFLIGPIINSALGVPAAAGHNTAILNGTLKQAGSAIVSEHQ
jgi:hypothetical protein